MSNSRIEEEQKANLLGEQRTAATNHEDFGDENQNDIDMRPSSSRVKKVLNWNKKTSQFELETKHIEELRRDHIKDDNQWREFETLYKDMDPAIHP